MSHGLQHFTTTQNELGNSLRQQHRYSPFYRMMGTCVDLSLTWASICEAVGLEPAIIVIPGHAFPAVRLPVSKQWLAIESTMLDKDFKDALERGKAELHEAQRGQHYLIDIAAMRQTGILGLDLPNVSEEYLTNLGYSFVAQKLETQPVSNTPPADATEDQTATDSEISFNPNGDQIDLTTLTGLWGGEGVEDGMPVAIGVCLRCDSIFRVALAYTLPGGSTRTHLIEGTWGRQGSQLVLTDGRDDTSYKYDFEFTSSELKLCILGGNEVITLARHQ